MRIVGWFFNLASVRQRHCSSPQDSAKGCCALRPNGEVKHAIGKFVDCHYNWATGKKGALKKCFLLAGVL